MTGQGKMRGSPFIAGLAFLSVLEPVGAWAQVAHSDTTSARLSETITYLPADFERFAPRTALDLVEKIPDFTLVETSDDRGLGEASQNVLINGQRVAGKSNDARTALAQISADAVERIEVTDGARLGIPGLNGRVANVIVQNRQIRVQLRWEAQNRRNIPDQWTSASVSASGSIGETDFTLSLSNSDASRRGGQGPELVLGADGRLLVSRWQRDVFRVDNPRLAGTLHREDSAGSILNASLSAERYIFRVAFDGITTAVIPQPLIEETFRQTDESWNVEAGADYEFAVGSGRLKLIGLQRYSDGPMEATNRARRIEAGAVATGTLFERSTTDGESVLRAEYGWGQNDAKWQLALEGAYNFLDVSSAIGSLRPDGSYARSNLQGGNIFVDEWRSNLSLTRGWRLADQISLQALIGAEYSRIRQTGAGGLSRQFWRPKGSATLAWTVNPRLTLNASLERRVGQLDFLDFSAAVDLINGVANAGNKALVPEQSWRVEAQLVRTIGSAGSITLGGYGEAISDIVDRVPISATEESIGNLPTAQRWGLIARGTVLLDAIGWRGGRLNASGEFRDSRVRDPITGDLRRISQDLVRRWSVDLRHDIPGTDIAWGGSVSEELRAPTFRLDQLFETRLDQPIATVFVEHKDVAGFTVRLGLRNVLNGEDDIRRAFYVDRRNGPIDFTEVQTRRIHLIGVLTVSGTF